MTEAGTVLIYDEEESRRATQLQMEQTARRFGIGGIGGIGGVGITEVGGPAQPAIGNGFPLVVQQPYVNQQPAYPLAQPNPIFTPQVLAPAEHLLLTPTLHPGVVRLVRMSGATRVCSWTVAEDAAATVAAIIEAFGITLTDLRESEEEQS